MKLTIAIWLFIIVDLVAYHATPRDIRTSHFWTAIPGGGFVIYMEYVNRCSVNGLPGAQHD